MDDQMHNQGTAVNAHYGSDQLAERILAALEATGKDLDALTPDALAPVDQFHIGGQPATRELARLAGLTPGTRLLDVGGGIGGTARTLASEFGCTVTVLDLTEAFCRAGELLTARTGLSDRVTFHQGDALDMPFSDGAFDVVWTQHATMNIADKPRLYEEIRRVLRPGGQFVLHDIMAGANQPIHFPVPWARDQAISFLRPPQEIRALLSSLGFVESAWIDVTATGIAWFRAWSASPSASATGLFPLSLQLLLGADFKEMGHNQVRNLEENRIAVIQGIFTRP